MNVTYYNRPKHSDSHSVEQVFEIVKKELEHKIQMRDYYCSPKWARTYSLLDAFKFQADVNHLTGDANHLSLVLDGKKTILTLHDMRHYEQDLSGLKKKLFGTFKLKLPFKKVKRVTTISNFMKEKVVQQFSIDPEKVRVIHNPAPSDLGYSPKKLNEKRSNILQIGSAPHKNLSRLIEAVEGLDVHLLLIRQKNPAIERKLQERKVPYTWKTNISREEVYACYRACDLLFFASEFEGFGVPILEANAVGRPVITSNVASMPEVAGESALLVDPTQVNEIRQAIIKITSDSELRKGLVEKGQSNLERFAPKNIAGQYLNLYREVAGSR